MGKSRDVACLFIFPAINWNEKRIVHYKEESYRKGRPCNLLLGEWAETLRHYW